MNDLKQLMDRYIEIVHSPKNQANKKFWENADEPYLVERWRGRSLRKTNTPFTMALDISGYARVLEIDSSKYYTDVETRLHEQLRYAIWEFENLDCCRYFEPTVFCYHGMLELSWYGCRYQLPPYQAPWYDESHPVFENAADLLKLKPFDFYHSGLNEEMLKDYEKMKKLCEGTELQVMMPVSMSGPFSAAIRLRGFNNLLMDLYDDPQYVEDLMDTIVGYIKEFSKGRAEYLNEPMVKGFLCNDEIAVPIVSPKLYRELILPRETELSNYWGGVRYWHSCGNTTMLFEEIAKIPGLQMMHVGPWSDPGHAAEVFGPKNVCLDICVNSVRDMYEKNYDEMVEQLTSIKNACDGKVRYAVRCDGIAILNSREELLAKVREWSRAARTVFPG